MSDINGFEIEDRVLKSYYGKDEVAVIPESVTWIEDYAFFGCEGLRRIEIPSSVVEIEAFAIIDCNELESLVVAKDNPKYHDDGNCIIETEKRALVVGCRNSVIPADGSVTLIGCAAFNGCTGLEGIDIPDTITSIEGHAFRDCRSLKEIFIPKKVRFIGAYALAGCDSLRKIEVDKDNYEYYSKGNCILRGGRGELVVGCRASIIPADGSVRQINDFAFSQCTLLTKIVIPDSIEWIGRDAFSGCHCLDNVVIPDSVIGIGDGAFSYCYGLESLTATDSITYIGRGVFKESDEVVITTTEDSMLAKYARENKISLKLV